MDIATINGSTCIIFCELMDVFKTFSIKLPLIFALGLNTFVEDFDGDTDGDEAL